MPRTNYNAADNSELRAIQSRLGSLPAPSKSNRSRRRRRRKATRNRRDGSGNIEASAFTVEYPDNWEAFGDNQSAMVTIAPRSGPDPGFPRRRRNRVWRHGQLLRTRTVDGRNLSQDTSGPDQPARSIESRAADRRTATARAHRLG